MILVLPFLFGCGDPPRVAIVEVVSAGKPDWIEVANLGGRRADLGEYALTDDLARPSHHFPFPTGYLAPGERLAIDARIGDDDTIFLAGPDGTTSVHPGPLPAGTSWGLGPDREGYFLAPTRGAPNDGPILDQPFVPGAVAVGEVAVDHAWAGGDWIEVVNRSDADVDLAGWGLSDESDTPAAWVFPAATPLAAGGRLLVREPGFDLDPHDVVLLTSPEGVPTDLVLLGGLGPQASLARTDAGWEQFTVPTPGGPPEGSPIVDEDVPVRITEVMARNLGAFTDVHRGTPDWIELANLGDASVDLTGFGLSDDEGHPFDYVFHGVTLRPGERRVVLASDAEPDCDEVHLGFSLAATGETVVLTHPSGRRLDALTTGPLRADMSAGHKDGGTFIFAKPTPGGPEGQDGWPGYAPMPTFSAAGGLVGPTTLTLSAPGATVHYRLDGGVPDERSPVATTIAIDRSVVVRAVAYADGLLPSNVATRTFLVGEQARVPVVAVTVDPVQMFDPEVGIHEAGPDALPEFPFTGANFWEKTEIATHFEWYGTDGPPGLDVDAGLRLNGARTRSAPQKSFRIVARGDYGPSELKYQFFEDDDLDHFDSVVLRAAASNDGRARLADLLGTCLAEGTGLDHQQFWRPIVVYINGEYRGLYHLREKVDEDWLASRHGLDPDTIDLLRANGAPDHGQGTDYRKLVKYVATHDLRDPTAYAWVKQRMEVGNFADYQIFEIYSANPDNGNIRFWRASDRKWRWILYDLDLGFDRIDDDTLAYVTNPEGTGYTGTFETTLLVGLLRNDEFRQMFLDRWDFYLDHVFQPDRGLACIDRIAAAHDAEAPRHVARWGSSMKSWGEEVDTLRRFVVDRPAMIKKLLRQQFNLSEAEMQRFEPEVA